MFAFVFILDFNNILSDNTSSWSPGVEGLEENHLVSTFQQNGAFQYKAGARNTGHYFNIGIKIEQINFFVAFTFIYFDFFRAETIHHVRN